jgi:hypothetical protein
MHCIVDSVFAKLIENVKNFPMRFASKEEKD